MQTVSLNIILFGQVQKTFSIFSSIDVCIFSNAGTQIPFHQMYGVIARCYLYIWGHDVVQPIIRFCVHVVIFISAQ